MRATSKAFKVIIRNRRTVATAAPFSASKRMLLPRQNYACGLGVKHGVTYRADPLHLSCMQLWMSDCSRFTPHFKKRFWISAEVITVPYRLCGWCCVKLLLSLRPFFVNLVPSCLQCCFFETTCIRCICVSLDCPPGRMTRIFHMLPR